MADTEDPGVIIDPRNFIIPPFERCPICGAADGLGVLRVQPDHLVRRCRECLRPGPGEPRAIVSLPPLSKRVLYLDQFAISNAMYQASPDLDPAKHARAQRWQVLVKIQHLVRMQALVCPSSSFHIDEALPFVHGSELQRTWTALSAGTRFEEKSTIEIFQLSRLAELWDRGAPPELQEILKDPIIEPTPNGWTNPMHVIVNLSFYDGIKDDIQAARSSLASELTDLFDEWEQHRPTFEAQLAVELAAYGQSILRSVVAFETDKARFWGSGVGELPLPGNPVRVFESLRHTFSDLGYDDEQAAGKAVEFLRSEFVKNLPRARLAALLFAGVARKIGGGMSPATIGNGIATDVAMVSTLLPYCDGILVDRFVGGLLREQPTAGYVEDLQTSVFSASSLDDLDRWLDGIALELDADHLAAVVTAYGDGVVDEFKRAFAL